MKTADIQAGKVYGDGLGRKRRVVEIYNIPGFIMVNYEKVTRNLKTGNYVPLGFKEGTCKLQTFASWAKEEIN